MDVVDLPLEQIIPYARNPRRNEQAIATVAASIQEFGWRQPIVVDEAMVVLAGHTRLEAARKLGFKTAPVHVAKGLTVSQARAFRIMDNRSSENAEWDKDLLNLELADLLEARAAPGARVIVAVAGAPGSGKSTLADKLVGKLNARQPGLAAVLPMDGYHYDDLHLVPAGLRPTKGAPDTFDVGGLYHTLSRLRAADEDFVAVPVFDRSIEIARAALLPTGPETRFQPDAAAVAAHCRKAKYRIRCNSIHPDGVMTPMTAGSYPKGVDPARFTIDADPMNRACLPEDVAAAILFLAEDSARAVNGIELRVDSGQFVMSI